MKQSDQWRNPPRGVGFEPFEDRLALSAEPIADFALDAFEDHPIQALAGVSPLAAEGHGWNEVAYAREQFGLRGSKQTVAVIDSGIAYDHVALGGGYGWGHRVVGGWDFAEGDANPFDDGPAGFHGTHVSGIIGSSDSRYTGVASNVDLVALRVFDDSGNGQLSWVEHSLRWVHTYRNSFENPITTVNLSLGTDWNSISALPKWAALEDEFRQLEQDGIFISVAAGNSFRTYQSAGLSYPAVSPYVVPVASVGSSGGLSSFSQRSDRVLAAPGERVMSTVPDAFFGGDGYKNDWGAASGTSMAAPYVAGASVLLREAMQSLGYAGITQDKIYDHFRNTADFVWDSATQANYRRINLQRALDTLVGADDFGSGVATASSLGTLSSSTAFTGTIGRLGDQDYFRFTADGNGTVTFSAKAVSGDLNVALQTAGSGATLSGGKLTLNVVAGQTFTIGLGSSGGIGKYSLDVQVVKAQASTPTAANWGTVDFALRDGVRLTSGDAWFQVTASRAGLLTVEAMFAQTGGNVDLEIYDSQRRLIGSSATAGNERVDVTAAAGGVYYVRARGTNADVDFRLTNLVTVSGSTVDIAGTSAADTFRWTAGAQQQIAVNGVQYAFANLTSVRFQGGAGQDSISLIGGIAAETATLRSGSVELVASAYRVSAAGIENINLVGGVNDLAFMHGSAGNDLFTVTGGSRVVTGVGYVLQTDGFQRVQFDGEGGSDRVELRDLTLADTVYGRRGYGRLTNAQFKTELSDIDSILAHARAGQRTRTDIRTVDFVFQKIGR